MTTEEFLSFSIKEIKEKDILSFYKKKSRFIGIEFNSLREFIEHRNSIKKEDIDIEKALVEKILDLYEEYKLLSEEKKNFINATKFLMSINNEINFTKLFNSSDSLIDIVETIPSLIKLKNPKKLENINDLYKFYRESEFENLLLEEVLILKYSLLSEKRDYNIYEFKSIEESMGKLEKEIFIKKECTCSYENSHKIEKLKEFYQADLQLSRKDFFCDNIYILTSLETYSKSFVFTEEEYFLTLDIINVLREHKTISSLIKFILRYRASESFLIQKNKEIADRYIETRKKLLDLKKVVLDSEKIVDFIEKEKNVNLTISAFENMETIKNLFNDYNESFNEYNKVQEDYKDINDLLDKEKHKLFFDLIKTFNIERFVDRLVTLFHYREELNYKERDTCEINAVEFLQNR